MAKKKSKLKKILKKLGKVAMLGGAAYGASKLFGGRRKGNAARYTEGDIGLNQRSPIVDDYNYIPKPDYGNPEEGLHTFAAKGGRIGAKKGGKVSKRGIGIAQRGFGRALKGKK